MQKSETEQRFIIFELEWYVKEKKGTIRQRESSKLNMHFKSDDKMASQQTIKKNCGADSTNKQTKKREEERSDNC